MTRTCSESTCSQPAVAEIKLRGESNFTDKKYFMWVYACQTHYDMEKKAGAIVDEKILHD